MEEPEQSGEGQGHSVVICLCGCAMLETEDGFQCPECGRIETGE